MIHFKYVVERIEASEIEEAAEIWSLGKSSSARKLAKIVVKNAAVLLRREKLEMAGVKIFDSSVMTHEDGIDAFFRVSAEEADLAVSALTEM